MQKYPIYLAGEWQISGEAFDVINPYTDQPFATTYNASSEQIERAVAAAVEAFEETHRMPAHERATILERIREGVRQRKEEFARLMALEAGKPIKDAAGEVERGLLTLTTSAEEARRLCGEAFQLDVAAASQGRFGITRRFPLGPVLGITPFNFPLNLVLHKLGPAIAAGDTVVIKPAPKTPLTALLLAEILADAGLPKGAVSIIPASNDLAQKLVEDDRFKVLSFTGSVQVGWRLKSLAGKKRVVLELGGNAGVIVDRDANLDYAVQRIKTGGFSYAGQSCISVQRTYAHQDIYDGLAEKLLAAVEQLKMGDPLDPATELGPMINRGVVDRTVGWIREAVAEGGKILTGGHQAGAYGTIFAPTVLANVPLSSKICRMEVFAPLVGLFPFRDFRAAVAAVNDSEFGLQAGVFTNTLDHAWYAFEELQVGGVIVNDVSAFRIDPMPYGGAKDSGLGREGPRYAIEDMTELRLMVLNKEGTPVV